MLEHICVNQFWFTMGLDKMGTPDLEIQWNISSHLQLPQSIYLESELFLQRFPWLNTNEFSFSLLNILWHSFCETFPEYTHMNENRLRSHWLVPSHLVIFQNGGRSVACWSSVQPELLSSTDEILFRIQQETFQMRSWGGEGERRGRWNKNAGNPRLNIINQMNYWRCYQECWLNWIKIIRRLRWRFYG